MVLCLRVLFRTLNCASCFLSIQEAAVFNPWLPGAISLSYLQDILGDPQGGFSQRLIAKRLPACRGCLASACCFNSSLPDFRCENSC